MKIICPVCDKEMKIIDKYDGEALWFCANCGFPFRGEDEK
jgi:ribosomal protein L37AE/L43A